MEKPVQAKELYKRQIPYIKQSRDASEMKVAKQQAGRQEKPLLFIMYPYRKPTQVDEERILRPTEEVLLRNSAKWPRNFGRRGAREEAAENGPSNCLTKTQVYAKPQR